MRDRRRQRAARITDASGERAATRTAVSDRRWAARARLALRAVKRPSVRTAIAYGPRRRGHHRAHRSLDDISARASIIDLRVEEALRPAVTLRFRSAEHTSELQSLMRTSYDVFCLQKKTHTLIIP